MYLTFYLYSTAEKLADLGAQETSTVTLETIAKISKNKGSGAVLPVFRSDASKVISKGMGLKKAYCGKQNQFNINTSDAGNYSKNFANCLHYTYSTIFPYLKAIISYMLVSMVLSCQLMKFTLSTPDEVFTMLTTWLKNVANILLLSSGVRIIFLDHLSKLNAKSTQPTTTIKKTCE